MSQAFASRRGAFLSRFATRWRVWMTAVLLLLCAGNAFAQTPAISGISPGTATTGGPGFTLTVNGSNFAAGAVVRWNGANRTTTFNSATSLSASIPASDIAFTGTATVTVLNPGGGGGTSNGVTFTIVAPLIVVRTSQSNVSCNGGANGVASISVSGGTVPYIYTWSPSGGTGATAAGLSAGTYTVHVADSSTPAQQLHPTYTITQPSALAISPASLPGGSVGSAYSQAITASGGASGYSYHVSLGALPAGMSLNAVTGVLSGTPTAAGTFPLTVTATDANGCFRSNNYSLTVASLVRPTATIVLADTSLSISETSLVTIVFSEAVSGFDNSDLTIANGSLSSVSSTDGGITWTATLTPAAGVNDSTNRITLDNTGVQNAAGNTGTGTTDSNNYAIDGLRPTATILVADTSLAAGETSLVTITFSEAVAGFTTADLTVANGTVSGLSSSDGGITWTATLTPSANVADPSNLITLNNPGISDPAGNAGTGTTNSNNYAVNTVGADVSIDKTLLTPGPYVFNQSVQYSLVVSNVGPGAATNVQVTDTPTNLTITGVSGACAALPCTLASLPPGASATITVTATISAYGAFDNAAGATATETDPDSSNNTDNTGNGGVTRQPQTIVFNGPGPVAYGSSTQLSAMATPSGLPVTFTSLTPAVCTVTPADVLTTVSDGLCQIEMHQAGDSTWLAATRTEWIQILSPTLAMTPAAGPLPLAYGAPTTVNFSTSGGTAPYNYSIPSGSLPVGMSLSSAGVLSGTPTVPGAYNVIIRATDSSTGGTAPYRIDQPYLLLVAVPVISFNPTSIPDGAVGVAYNASLGAQDGVAPYSYSLLSGSLPIGMTLTSGGVLSGVPRSDGAFSLTVRATDAHGQSASRVFTFNIAAPTLAITPASLPNGTGGVVYGQTLSTSGGIAPYAYSIVSGTLPVGVSFSSAGVFAGTPTVAGSHNVVIRSTDDAGYGTTIAYTIVIDAPAIAITPATLANGSVGDAYSASFSAAGGTAPYGFSLLSGSLPTGMTFTSGGVLSGTPATAGTFNFTVRASDGHGFTGDLAYALVIGKSAQTIAFGTQASQTYASGGTFALAPAATASSGLAVSYSSQTASVCSISGSTVTMLSAGSCVIAADQMGDANYDAAAQVTQAIAIAQAAQAITGFASNPTAPTFAPNGTFTLSATGGASGNPVLFASTSASVCTVSGNTVTMLSAGNCALTANQAGDANYSAAPQVTLDVTIGKAKPVLSWTTNLSKTYGEPEFDLPLPTSSSPAAFTFASSDAAVATVSGRTVTITGTGTTTLTATQAETANYAAASISITLTVDGRPDPTRDPSVAGSLQAQVDASVRFVQTQQDNIRGRLRQLRSGGNASSNNVAISVQGGWNQPSLSLNAGQSGMTPRMPQGWGFWSAGSVMLGERDARGMSDGFEFRSDGVTFGVDRLVSENAVFGAAGSFGWNDSDLNDRRSSLDARQRSLALYGLWRSDAWFVDGILGWGRLKFDIARWSEVADATATAQREGDQAFGGLTLGYEHRAGATTLTGYGRLDASRTTLDAYRENGLGIYDLQYAQHDVDSSTAAVGLEGRYGFRTEVAMLRPYWTLEWRQALQNQADAGINYVLMPRSSDYVLGLRSYNDNVAAFGVGMDMDFGNDWSLALQFRREQASNAFDNSFGLRISYGGSTLMSAGLAQWLPGGQVGLTTTESGQAQP